jgi:hypothetical protein
MDLPHRHSAMHAILKVVLKKCRQAWMFNPRRRASSRLIPIRPRAFIKSSYTFIRFTGLIPPFSENRYPSPFNSFSRKSSSRINGTIGMFRFSFVFVGP